MYQKRLSYLCFLPKGKKRHFTPYNQGVRLLISLCRGRAKTYFVTGVDVSILETKFYNQMQSKQIFHFDSSGVPLYSHIRHNQKSQVKNPASANYDTKNTSTFQLFHCQQTQSLLITLYNIA
jgi:hypothetical protein